MEGAESRRLDRTHVLLKATIITPDGPLEARIKDLSASGAQIFCCVPLRADRDVIFQRGSIFAAARVAWSDKESAGLEFYRPLDPIAFRNDRPL